ncbi:MAG: peptidoglycan-binding protein [Rhizobiales bacterium]|jgi:hypothetical protein|nr:peptidoglycan-binding protein [Hyphomicrobiales bacterium]
MITTLNIRRRLADRGYAPGPADSVPGCLTLVSVKQLQPDQGLAIDGVVGP